MTSILRHTPAVAIHIEPTADVSDRATVGEGTRVWHLVQIREDARVGANCNIGRGAYVGPGVRVGDNCKLHNYSLVFEPAVLGNGVFIGPAAVLTNDLYPRAVNTDGSLKSGADWDEVAVTIGDGAAIGARAVCVAPVHIGRWALVAAGSVVIHDVPDFAAVVGVPARQIGWVGKAGKPLRQVEPGVFECPDTRERYLEVDGVLSEADSRL